MKVLLLSVLIMAAGPVSGQATERVMLQPGYWQRTSKLTVVSVDGKLVPKEAKGAETSSTFSDCYSVDDMADTQSFFGRAAANAGCGDIIAIVTDGTIAVSGKCIFQGLNASLNGTGHFNSNNYQENITIETTVAKHRVTAVGLITGKYLRECSSTG